ncbi:MAG: PEP-CTERM sorting domain-containing protein [Verrucomicrobiota bacterium]
MHTSFLFNPIASRAMICSTVLSLAFAASATATLMIDVSGTAGSGQTTWTFSGTSTANQTGVNANFTTSNVNYWANLSGEYTLIAQDVADFVSSTAVATGAISGAHNITGIEFGKRFGGGNRFGWAINSNQTYSSGETLTYSGSGVFAVDITSFTLFDTTLTDNTSSAGLLNLTVNSPIAAIPEPSTIISMGAFSVLGGLLFFVRRRKQRRATAAAE